MAKGKGKKKRKTPVPAPSPVALAMHDAAKKTRTASDWPATNSSADTAILADYGTLLARARAAVRDDPLGAGIVDGHVRHAIGSGIRAIANCRDLDTDEPNEPFNVRNNWLWERWARDPEACDQEGRKTISQMQRLAMSEYIVAGQSFTILNYAPRADQVGLTLQMFEPEQLDTSRAYAPLTGNQIHGGIEIDQYGKTLAYWVYTGKHPLEGSGGNSERILAERVIHVMRPTRCRQTQGVTRLTPSLRAMYNLQAYNSYMILRARQEACIGAVIQSDANSPAADLGGALGPAGTETTDGRGNTEFRFEPNMLWDLPAGKSAVFNTPSTPGGTYEPFVAVQSRMIAAGSGMDQPTIMRDYSGGSYASLRQGMLETWGETDVEQDIFIWIWLRRVREAFTRYAILEGRLDAPNWDRSADDRAMYLEAVYRPPLKPWIDPANEAAAAKILLELKLTTRRELIASRNGDWREVFQQLADEEALAKELKINLAAVPTVGAPSGQPHPTRATTIDEPSAAVSGPSPDAGLAARFALNPGPGTNGGG